MKVPRTYFRHVSVMGFLLLPIVWILLPIAGFQPSLLSAYLPKLILKAVFKFQVQQNLEYLKTTL